MPLPATYDLELYRGDDFDTAFGLVAPGGRVVDDLELTSGSATATSASAAFVAADAGKAIVTHDGTGITDSCTILAYVNATTVTLSQTASASGQFAASIRALDASGYSSPLAQIRASADDGTVLATFSWNQTRSDVGVFVMSLEDTVTDDLPTTGGVWDWQILDDNDRKRTLLRGAVSVTADVSKP